MHIDTALKQHTDNLLSVNDTVKFMFIVQIAMCHYDMYVKVAYDNFDNKRRYDEDMMKISVTVESCRWANCPDLFGSAAPSNSHPFPSLVVCESSAASRQSQQQQQRPCDVLFNQLLAADSERAAS